MTSLPDSDSDFFFSEIKSSFLGDFSILRFPEAYPAVITDKTNYTD